MTIFKVSLAQEFAYKTNFIMWRVRNVLQVFLIFFLWDAVFSEPGTTLFGYDRTSILTYVFGLLIVRGLVLSVKSYEVAGDIGRGDLSNYLTKPLSYFKYWLTRDISSKTLNVVFAIGETIFLYLILKPPFYLQTNPVLLVSFLVTLIIAMLIYFILIFILGSISFWAPELAWGVGWLFITIIIQFMSGAMFPLDVFPQAIQDILRLTPFPYLIFFPIQVYLGQISISVIIKGILVSGIWLVVLWFIFNSVWKRGLRVYQSHGK